MIDEPTSLILEHLKAIRAEQSQHRTLLLHHGELLRRVERRIAEVERRIEETKDDLEMMLKAELMGRLGNFETQIDARLDAIEERLKGH